MRILYIFQQENTSQHDPHPAYTLRLQRREQYLFITCILINHIHLKDHIINEA